MFTFKPKQAARVLFEVRQEIAFVTLNRSEKYNGLDRAMLEALVAVHQKISADKTIRAVIINGAGRGFCSGLDIMSFKNNPLKIRSLLKKEPGNPANLVQQVSFLWRSLPVPVIAVIHGKCFGGGLQIAMGADFRFASEDAELAILEAKWGLVPDMAGMLAWREVLRGDVLRELVYTGRTIDAQEALAIGLVSKVCSEPLMNAEQFAQQLRQRSPDSIAAAKILINEMWSASPAEVLDLETRLQQQVLGKWNQLAAASRNLRKKPLQYHRRKINQLD